MLINNMAQKINLFQKQVTLGFFDIKLVLFQQTKYLIQQYFMFFYSPTIDEQIIKITKYTIVQQLKEYLVHHSLKSTRR